MILTTPSPPLPCVHPQLVALNHKHRCDIIHMLLFPNPLLPTPSATFVAVVEQSRNLHTSSDVDSTQRNERERERSRKYLNATIASKKDSIEDLYVLFDMFSLTNTYLEKEMISPCVATFAFLCGGRQRFTIKMFCFGFYSIESPLVGFH
jgi:hypothetical protein